MNPNGVVPTIDDGGRMIWESNSAVRYLSAKYAAGTLWPNDPGQRSEADRWMDWQLSTISERHARRSSGAWCARRPRSATWRRSRRRPRMPASCSAGSTRSWQTAAMSRGQHFTMGDIPVGCFVHRWHALDIERPDAQEPAGLVRPAGDAAGLRQARHGEADLTLAGGAPSAASRLSTSMAEPGRAGVEAGRQHARGRARGRSASAGPRSAPCPRRRPSR